MAAQPFVADLDDTNFVKLFQAAAETRNYEGASGDQIREAIHDIVSYFNQNGPALAFAPENFSRNINFLAFFYRYSPLAAAITRNRTLFAIQNCAEFRSFFQQPSLNVVNVGGGASSDLVGLFSALYGNSSFQAMHITVMDLYSEWEPYLRDVEQLLCNGDFGNASQLIRGSVITNSFVTTDLTNWMDPDQQLETAFREANLVFMKGFLSALGNGFRGNDTRYNITKKIVPLMKPGALLVVMDSPSYVDFDRFIRAHRLEKICESNFGNYHLQSSNFQPTYRVATDSNQEIYIYKKNK